MKKVNVLLGRRIQKLLSCDTYFQGLQVLENAMDAVRFFFVMAATGRIPARCLTTFECDINAPRSKGFVPEEFTLLGTAYRLAGRIEAQIEAGEHVDVCLSVNINFYGPGRNAQKLLEIFVIVDQQAVRKYCIARPDDQGLRAQYLLVVHQKPWSR